MILYLLVNHTFKQTPYPYTYRHLNAVPVFFISQYYSPQ